MAAGLLSGITDALFGNVDNSQYLQAYAQQQAAALEAQKREAMAAQQQQRYGQYLQAVMNGTAPSMAQLQLSQGMGAIAQGQQSMAAGQAGPGQALGQYGAAVNTANAQSQANQAAALARVKEQNDARAAYGSNAAAMQQGALGMFNNTSQNALGFAGVASGQGIAQFNRTEQDKGLGGLFNAAGSAAGQYFGRQPDTSSSGGGSSTSYDTGSS